MMKEAEQIARFRNATGMGWLAARKFLRETPAVLCERILRAGEYQDGETLHDPIEDEPSLQQQFAEARRRANEAVRAWTVSRNEQHQRSSLGLMASEHPRGSCYVVWREMKRILSEDYQIEWFSPAEMNPGSVFD